MAVKIDTMVSNIKETKAEFHAILEGSESWCRPSKSLLDDSRFHWLKEALGDDILRRVRGNRTGKGRQAKHKKMLYSDRSSTQAKTETSGNPVRKEKKDDKASNVHRKDYTFKSECKIPLKEDRSNSASNVQRKTSKINIANKLKHKDDKIESQRKVEPPKISKKVNFNKVPIWNTNTSTKSELPLFSKEKFKSEHNDFRMSLPYNAARPPMMFSLTSGSDRTQTTTWQSRKENLLPKHGSRTATPEFPRDETRKDSVTPVFGANDIVPISENSNIPRYISVGNTPFTGVTPPLMSKSFAGISSNSLQCMRRTAPRNISRLPVRKIWPPFI